MARTDRDSWDLATSVGATATMVAAARALATEETNPIIEDPFAAPLVRAVGVDFFTRLVDHEVTPAEIVDGAGLDMARETDSMAVRTRFFDEFFLNAANAGVRQSVILAAGLDSRPYRLAWPPGSIVYEVDQPKVIDFKTATMSTLGAAPTAERRTVAVDLRDDWPAALRSSGFDDTTPTAWSAEGLLIYLPPDAQDRLFDNITELSAPGSQLATEYHPDSGAAAAEREQALADRWRGHGFGVNMSDLVYVGERSALVDYLSTRGWQVTTRSRPELFAAYGRDLPDGDDDALAWFRSVVALIATRT